MLAGGTGLRRLHSSASRDQVGSRGSIASQASGPFVAAARRAAAPPPPLEAGAGGHGADAGRAAAPVGVGRPDPRFCPPEGLSIPEFDELIFSDHPDYRPPNPS